MTHASYTPSGAEFGEEIRVTASNCALHRPEGKSVGKKEGAAGIAGMVERAEMQSEEERMRHNEQLEFLGDATLEFLCRCVLCVCVCVCVCVCGCVCVVCVCVCV